MNLLQNRQTTNSTIENTDLGISSMLGRGRGGRNNQQGIPQRKLISWVIQHFTHLYHIFTE
jgi:hypothetical protein